MDASFIAKKYVNEVKGNKISAEILGKLPKLVSAQHWDKVEIVGAVDYAFEVPHAYYKGILVKYMSGLYFMSQKVVDELAKIDRRFKKVNTVISVS